MSENRLDYKKNSGVDIDEGNRFVSVIKKTVESTYNKNVLGSIGGFAGFFLIYRRLRICRNLFLFQGQTVWVQN